MTHKFFKIVAITQDEYVDKTNDVTAAMFSQSVNPEDDAVYVAINVDKEYELLVDMDTLDYLTPEGKQEETEARWVKIYADGEPASKQPQIGVCCSKCMKMPKDKFTESDFCPNCGARMRVQKDAL